MLEKLQAEEFNKIILLTRLIIVTQNTKYLQRYKRTLCRNKNLLNDYRYKQYNKNVTDTFVRKK